MIQVTLHLEGYWDDPPETGFVTLLAGVEAGGALTVDSPFGVEPRAPDLDVYVHNVPTDGGFGAEGMFERPRPGLFWARSWCDWSKSGQGVAVVSVDGGNYWLKEPQQLGHVALRTLALKPGTWEEHLPSSWSGAGSHTFRYGILFHDGDWQQAGVQRRAAELRHPPIVARADFPKGACLPKDSHSFLALHGPAMLSACYLEDEDVLFRLYECTGVGGEVCIKLDWQPFRVQAIDLVGRPVPTPVTISGNCVKLTLRPWQIATLRAGRCREQA